VGSYPQQNPVEPNLRLKPSALFFLIVIIIASISRNHFGSSCFGTGSAQARLGKAHFPGLAIVSKTQQNGLQQ